MCACDHVMVGFGFGPIQAGLFAKEAREGECFTDIAVAEVDASLVAAVRSNNDSYAINVAYEDRVEPVKIEGVTLLNPGDRDDCQRLCKTLERATDIVTALPSVEFFTRGGRLRWHTSSLRVCVAKKPFRRLFTRQKTTTTPQSFWGMF